MSVTGNGPEGGVIDDRFGTAGTGKLVDHVLHGFVIGKALVVVMNGDALAQGFVDLLPEDVVEVRFTAEDQSEAVDGIVAVVHEHLDVVKDAVGKILGLVHSEQKRLPLFVIEVIDLFLNGLEHRRLSAFFVHTEDHAELLVEISDADGGKTDVFHVVEVGIERPGEAAETERLSHAGTGSEKTDAAGVFENVEAGSHLIEIS